MFDGPDAAAGADRVLVDVECRPEEAELVADTLFQLGAGAVVERWKIYDGSGPQPGSVAAAHLWLVADVDAAAVDKVQERWPHATVQPLPEPPPQRAVPYTVGGRLLVRPLGVRADVARSGLAPGYADLEIWSGQAFGAGTHPTTLGCLAEVVRLADEGRLGGARVLDVGAGTGVLGLAALALGADRLFAVDTDPAARRATRSNARVNGLGDRLRIVRLVKHPRNGFGLVLANLLAPVFDEIGASVAAAVAPGGVLVASGVLEDQVDRVLAVAPDLVVERQATVEDGWVVLTLTRPFPPDS